MSQVVTVFGSGKAPEGSQLYQEALRLGQLLGAAGFDIATGGYSGVMEAVLRGALPYAVRRIGVITAELPHRSANPYVGELLTVPTYLGRLQRLLELGTAYVLFPGGTGTLLELFALLALRERLLLPERPILCLGKQWQKVFDGIRDALPEMTEVQHMVSICRGAEEVLAALKRAVQTR